MILGGCTHDVAVSADAGDAGEANVAAPDAGEEPSDAGATDADAIDGGDAGPIDAGVVVDAGPPLPSFADEPFPEKATSFPKAEEWEEAKAVTVDRVHPPSLFVTHANERVGCRAQRVREWVRIQCQAMTGGAVLLGGNRDGLSIRFDKVHGGTEVIVPVRRGDRRVIEMFGSETLSFKAFSSERAKFGFVISEQWPAGDERPTIVAE
ncbi:Hypothetical protein A7982_05556 [Minicystis rosea]|nr:Hypothetical protein A7982_05556 [Minicystis rosea]